MKLVRAHQTDDLQSEIKKRFAEFNRSSSPSRGRRHPHELRELVYQAGTQGLKVGTLCRLTGLSRSAARRWLAEGPLKPAIPPAMPRRLSVVVEPPIKDPRTAPIVVRLPSGVTIELSDGSSLNGELLTTLSSLEVRHAPAR